MQKKDLRSVSLHELEREMKNMGESGFRGRQIFEWINKKLTADIDSFSNISLELRERLKDSFEISWFGTHLKRVSSIDGTVKYLFKAGDADIIESVLMKYDYGNSVCISSQVGCRMGCEFCASAISGYRRNLTAGEMCAQVYEIQKDSGQRVTNIVVMGIGEPLDNYDNLLRFIEIINAKEGLEIGQRHITVSTCGIVPRITELSELGLQITLAISLHAPNDEMRRELMPIAKKYTVEELVEAGRYYADKTKRRVTYEYALIKDVNDSKACASELARLLKGSMCHVNLIPINEIKERGYKGGTAERAEIFMKTLSQYNIEATVRKKHGADIEAACGQLRNKIMQTGDV